MSILNSMLTIQSCLSKLGPMWKPHQNWPQQWFALMRGWANQIKYQESILHDVFKKITNCRWIQISGCYIGLNFILKKINVKRVSKNLNFNLVNSRQIRSSLLDNAAKMFRHCIIFSHIEYCITNLSQTSMAILKQIESLY